MTESVLHRGTRFVTSEPARDGRSVRLFTWEWVPESFIFGERRLPGINVQLLRGQDYELAPYWYTCVCNNRARGGGLAGGDSSDPRKGPPAQNGGRVRFTTQCQTVRSSVGVNLLWSL